MATDTFLNVCHLLAHHSTRRALQIDGEPVDPNTIIYVREPCGLFHREIMCHLDRASLSTSFMPTFHSFMEAMLSPAHVHMFLSCPLVCATSKLLAWDPRFQENYFNMDHSFSQLCCIWHGLDEDSMGKESDWKLANNEDQQKAAPKLAFVDFLCLFSFKFRRTRAS
jgi:hypothetical protein